MKWTIILADKSLFCDKSYFHLGGLGNRHEFYEKRMHLWKCTAWSNFWLIVGSLFFESEVGNAVTAIGKRYRDTLQYFVWHRWENMCTAWPAVQWIGSTCHIDGGEIMTFNLQIDNFPKRYVSILSKVYWQARCCDLSPRYFIYGDFLNQRSMTSRMELPNLKI